jgi:hypothetical protein
MVAGRNLDFINPKSQYPVMQNTTRNDNLHLGWVGMEWFVIHNYEPDFQGPESMFNSGSEG